MFEATGLPSGSFSSSSSGLSNGPSSPSTSPRPTSLNNRQIEPPGRSAQLIPTPWQLFLHHLLPAPLAGLLHGSDRSDLKADAQGDHSVRVSVGKRGASQTSSTSSSAAATTFSSLERAAMAAAPNPAQGLGLTPHIVQRAYILGTPARPGGSAVSITERGITAKSILFALENGGIIELPKTILDPRRSLEMTQELQEEGLEPYMPELPLSTYAIITYNQSVQAIRRIHTAPSGLESTSLLFAYDLFFTRIAPSKTYDLLKDDFDHTFILTVTLGMIV
ncbi:unnamed protein product, partial [Protopolystoma xenopodis]